MSSEQLRLLLKDTLEHLFRLRVQSQTEKLDTPSELKKNRLLIARIQTVQRQRELKAGKGRRRRSMRWRRSFSLKPTEEEGRCERKPKSQIRNLKSQI